MTYTLLSLFWTLAGLVCGYTLGAAGRATANPPPEVVVIDEPPPPWWRRHLFGSRLLGVALVVLALLSVVIGAVYVDRQSEIVTCQNQYNRAFATAWAQRNEAAARERDGQRQLLDAALGPNRDRIALTEAYERYRALLAEADAQRNANPLPVSAC
jgi:hypothetical protein